MGGYVQWGEEERGGDEWGGYALQRGGRGTQFWWVNHGAVEDEKKKVWSLGAKRGASRRGSGGYGSRSQLTPGDPRSTSSLCYTSATPLLHLYYTSATPLLHLCYTFATPPLHLPHSLGVGTVSYSSPTVLPPLC